MLCYHIIPLEFFDRAAAVTKDRSAQYARRNAVQRRRLTNEEESYGQCHLYGAAGHVYCHCERSLNYIDPDSVIRQHMYRFAEQRCEFLTTSVFILKKGPGTGRRHGVEPKQIALHKSIKAVKKAYKNTSAAPYMRAGRRSTFFRHFCHLS